MDPIPTFPVSLPLAFFPLSTDRTYTLAEFEAFAFSNKELFIERENDGRISVLLPVGGGVGDAQAQFIASLTLHARQTGGQSQSSRMGYLLPDTSLRLCGASYISLERLRVIKGQDLSHFFPLVPDFIVEVVSVIRPLQHWHHRIAASWIANGVRLAWLADVDNDRLWIYRADHSVELVTPLNRTIEGEDVLPGFTFDLNLLS